MEQPTHICIDLFRCNLNPLQSETRIADYIKLVLEQMHMTPVGEANIVTFTDPIDVNKSGITATQIISESLISLHSYPEHRAVYIDLFSCKEFDISHLFSLSIMFFSSGIHYMNKVRRASITDVNRFQ